MIQLTKLNKKPFILNCELIESIEQTPDTVITLRNGKLVLAQESPEEIVAKSVAYKKEIFSGLVSVVPSKTQADEEDVL